MSVEIGHLSGAVRAYAAASQTTAPRPTAKDAAPERAPAAAGVAREATREDTVELSFPAAPPPEALAAVERAAQRVEELAAENRELHFSYNEQARRVVVEVRSLDGDVIRTIPPTSALDILAGGKL